MSQKRKIEEFHDPDYPQISLPEQSANIPNQPCKTFKPNETKLPDDQKNEITKTNKIISIIKREFGAEFNAKEREIDEIEERIEKGRKLLAKARYAIVKSYYTKKSLVITEDEAKLMSHNADNETGQHSLSGPNAIDGKFQPAIHPSLKKILGKRPVDYNEILKARPIRTAAKNATKKFHDLMKQPAATTKLKITNMTIPAEGTTEDVAEKEVIFLMSKLIKI